MNGAFKCVIKNYTLINKMQLCSQWDNKKNKKKKFIKKKNVNNKNYIKRGQYRRTSVHVTQHYW